MLFNSFQFIFFFPAVLITYFALPHRFRWVLLLVASYYFYMCWNADYIILIILATLSNYGAGLAIGKTDIVWKRKTILFGCLAINLGMLFMFKYFNFFNDSMKALFNQFNVFYSVPSWNFLLPVGISFFIFQSLSYSIDIYFKVRGPERHLGIFAVYVAFFPQLVAGPIERSTTLLPQFFKEKVFDYHMARSGLLMMLWGFFMKLVIADRLAVGVNNIFGNPQAYTGIPIILATYFFGFQVFCDFAGYSCIAIGAARMMGFDLIENFRQPYFSKSISEFWNRWHISMSSWFRDYVFYPLSSMGNRTSKKYLYACILIVFIITGLWHGAYWTFLLFGVLHGLYIVLGLMTQNIRKKICAFLLLDRFPVLLAVCNVFITFHLVIFSFIFFRAKNLTDSVYIVRHMFSGLTFDSRYGLGMGLFEVCLALFFLTILMGVEFLHTRMNLTEWFYSRNTMVRWSVYFFLSLSIILFGQFSGQQFIYFQF